MLIETIIPYFKNFARNNGGLHSLYPLACRPSQLPSHGYERILSPLMASLPQTVLHGAILFLFMAACNPKSINVRIAIKVGDYFLIFPLRYRFISYSF